MDRIMVIDSCLQSLNLIGYYLERNGYLPVQVEDIEDAPMAILNEPPAAILVNLERGVPAAMEVIDLVRSWPHTARTPWVVITKRVAELGRQIGFQVTVDGYLAAPVTEAALVARLRAALAANGGARRGRSAARTPAVGSSGGDVLEAALAMQMRPTGFWPSERIS